VRLGKSEAASEQVGGHLDDRGPGAVRGVAPPDAGRPHVGPVTMQNSGPTASSSRTSSHGGSCPTPTRPCRPRDVARLCRVERPSSRGAGRGRLRRARALPGSASRLATTRRPTRATGSHAGRRQPRASRQRSPPPSADPPASAALCSVAGAPHGTPARRRRTQPASAIEQQLGHTPPRARNTRPSFRSLRSPATRGGQASRLSWRHPPARLLAMICSNILRSAVALSVSPS